MIHCNFTWLNYSSTCSDQMFSVSDESEIFAAADHLLLKLVQKLFKSDKAVAKCSLINFKNHISNYFIIVLFHNKLFCNKTIEKLGVGNRCVLVTRKHFFKFF